MVAVVDVVVAAATAVVVVVVVVARILLLVVSRRLYAMSTFAGIKMSSFSSSIVVILVGSREIGCSRR